MEATDINWKDYTLLIFYVTSIVLSVASFILVIVMGIIGIYRSMRDFDDQQGIKWNPEKKDKL